jgi:hypothetical protein
MEQTENPYRVAAKPSDVSPHPVKSQSLILDGQVRLAAVSEAEDVEPVVDGDEDERLARFNRVSDEPGGV